MLLNDKILKYERIKMNLEINKEEQKQLMAALDVAVKSSQNSLQTAQILLPLANKISALTDKKDKPDEIVVEEERD
jgi:hypothetical protein